MRRIRRNLNQRTNGSIALKHLLALRDYWTPLKIYNLILCEIEKRGQILNTHSMPYIAKIDVTNACNLRCPGCPTGAGILGRQKTVLDLNRLEKFLKETAKYLFIAHLYNWGETLLHPQAPEIVKMVHDRKIFTSISSNLNLKDFSKIEAVCEAGLDHIIISADGATEESYKKYRVGGNFELVLDNIRRLVAYRRSRKKTRPILEWQIVAFNYLESELERAFALAEELGVDWFTVRGPIAPDRLQPDSENLKGSYYGLKKSCAMLWHYVALQSDGGIAPCCNLYHKKDDFGHIDEASVFQIRKNERYRKARMLFDPNRLSELDKNLNHPCLRCPIVHRQTHLESFLESNSNAYAQVGFMGVLSEESEEEKIWNGL